MVALTLANAVLEKFGGDSIDETRRNLEAYLAAIPDALRTEVAAAEVAGERA
jgi:chorismate synthase